ncbi:hypothetical protein M9Y10_038603 [Tritrichomonas musculus]|uniref:Transketolase n=1 Tax=Tritrichomonas musculus TaxID=1915356 RepID=A0ABR2K8W9_9EUKA
MSDIDTLCVNTIRVLSADMIQKAKSGHPGAPLGLAPAAHILWTRFLEFAPNWLNRDRFVLSCGHASALYYSLLHLHSNIVSLDDIKQFRQYKSKTPGHPEHRVLPEVEVTTGPLGQGITNAVGLSIAQHFIAAKFNKPDLELFTHKVWCFASDGDMMEGISSEAASIAGFQKLDNLIVLYDSNHITIDGSTDLTFTEDVSARFRAFGWHTIYVKNADTDYKEIENAINEALKVKNQPVLITLNTTIGYGSPVANTNAVHGAPLTDPQLVELKKALGFNPEEFFVVSKEVYDYYAKVRERTAKKVEQWNFKYAEYDKKYHDDFKLLHTIMEGKFSYEEFDKFMPKIDESTKGTRVPSGVALNIVAQHAPGLIGGSADLTPSTNTTLKGEKLFTPSQRDGRYIEFGIREHAMQAIANGIQFYGFKGLIPFTSTFFVFYNYLLPAVRIAALEHLRELMIFTHDSIGVGEDGPTHQPVEGMAQLRVMPGVSVFRPACQMEVNACYTEIFCGPSRPCCLILSRQNTPPIPGSSYEGTLKGAYVIKKAENPQLILVSNGTELDLALKAAELLKYPVTVVSMPCMDLYDRQPLEYKRSVFPKGVPIVSIEASVPYPWEKYSHQHLGVPTYGVSAPAPDVYKHFGLYPEKIAENANYVVEFYKGRQVPDILDRP